MEAILVLIVMSLFIVVLPGLMAIIYWVLTTPEREIARKKARLAVDWHEHLMQREFDHYYKGEMDATRTIPRIPEYPEYREPPS